MNQDKVNNNRIFNLEVISSVAQLLQFKKIIESGSLEGVEILNIKPKSDYRPTTEQVNSLIKSRTEEVRPISSSTDNRVLSFKKERHKIKRKTPFIKAIAASLDTENSTIKEEFEDEIILFKNKVFEFILIIVIIPKQDNQYNIGLRLRPAKIEQLPHGLQFSIFHNGTKQKSFQVIKSKKIIQTKAMKLKLNDSFGYQITFNDFVEKETILLSDLCIHYKQFLAQTIEE